MSTFRRLTNRTVSQPLRMVDHDTAATYAGVSCATFDRLVAEGRFPKPVDLYGEVVWDLTLIDRVLDRMSGLRRNTAD